mgnify:CR=1 FL=1
MNYILFDDQCRNNLLPLTFTRPAAEIRVGILTIREKWESRLHKKCSWNTLKYLSAKYPLQTGADNILINGRLIPDTLLMDAIQSLRTKDVLQFQNIPLAVRLPEEDTRNFVPASVSKYTAVEYKKEPVIISNPWDIFKINGEAIQKDFEYLTANRESGELSASNNILGKDNIFVEPGVKAEFATINAFNGPVYLGKDTEIMEGSLIRGPFAICEGSTLKLGAKIYGPSTIGPQCKVGGEVNNSVFFGYSNKAHDGFLGNSVIGEWCNIGADSNNSNLKNNYAEVKLWNYDKESFIKTGLQFCGLIMGDHSKCGINTMFNTGTVIGVSANIFGSGFPRNFIPSFAWGGAHGYTTYSLPKAFETAKLVMSRRNKEFNDIEKKIFREIYDFSEKYRKF